MKSLVNAALIALGIVTPVSVATAPVQVIQAPTEIKQSTVAEKPRSSREIRQDIFNDFSSGIAYQFYRQCHLNPAQYGMTRDCQKKMRQSRMRGRGIGGGRI